MSRSTTDDEYEIVQDLVEDILEATVKACKYSDLLPYLRIIPNQTHTR